MAYGSRLATLMNAEDDAMIPNRHAVALLFVCSVAHISGCSNDLTQPTTGVLIVSVNDLSSQVPVPGVEIEITPVGLVSTTNNEGVAVFEVAPGDYFVNASVCCRGPGFIEYQVPITVAGGETQAVELQACLACIC